MSHLEAGLRNNCLCAECKYARRAVQETVARLTSERNELRKRLAWAIAEVIENNPHAIEEAADEWLAEYQQACKASEGKGESPGGRNRS